MAVAQGFSVDPDKLRAGSHDMTSLRNRCASLAGDTVGALSGMVGAAGHVGLAAALTGAAGQGARTFFAIGSAYGHTGDSLTISAQNYSANERNLANKFRSLFSLEA